MLAYLSVIIGGLLCITLIGLPIGLAIIVYGCFPLQHLIGQRVHKKAISRYRSAHIGPDLYPWEAEEYSPRSSN